MEREIRYTVSIKVQRAVDTAEPPKGPKSQLLSKVPLVVPGRRLGRRVSKIGKFCKKRIAKFCKFLVGSFSAVSRRNFARKYAFDSILQALQDLYIFFTVAISKV